MEIKLTEDEAIHLAGVAELIVDGDFEHEDEIILSTLSFMESEIITRNRALCAIASRLHRLEYLRKNQMELELLEDKNKNLFQWEQYRGLQTKARQIVDYDERKDDYISAILDTVKYGADKAEAEIEIFEYLLKITPQKYN